MENVINEKYKYKDTKRYILDLLNSMDKKINESLKFLPNELDYLIKASNELGLPFIYLLIGLKNKEDKNIVTYFISLYFEEIEKKRLENLFHIISETFNYIVPEKYLISNPIEDEFIKNIENFGILESNSEKIPRKEITDIENTYAIISSAIDYYNTYKEIGDNLEEGITLKDMELKYDECKKEIEKLKNNKNIKNLEYNIDFFNDLLNLIDIKSLNPENDKKVGLNDDVDLDEFNNIEKDLSLSRSLSKSLSQHLEKVALKNRTFFFYHETVSYGEDIETEFKNYRFFNPNKEIIPYNLTQKIQKLICGLLNNKGGRVYFGIDDEKVVKGNVLTYKQRDELRLELLNLTSNFYPDCKTSKISVHFIPIKDNNQQFLNNLYVTKMIVKQGDPEKLYSISNKVYESYKRIQGMVSQLKPEVIAEEIYKRKSKPEEPIPDKEFIDPEPEENFYESKIKIYNDNYNSKNYNQDNYIETFKSQKKKKKKYKDNYITIKIKNISEETPIFILEALFEDYNDVIENMKLFEKNGMSLGYGFIDVRDKESAQSLINAFDRKNINGKEIHLFIKK